MVYNFSTGKVKLSYQYGKGQSKQVEMKRPNRKSLISKAGSIGCSLVFLVLLLVSVHFIVIPEETSVAADRAIVYRVNASENAQRDIRQLCEENHLSYELVLAIFETEDIYNILFVDMKTEIDSIVFIRDYWVEHGFSDEVVFRLLLISRHSGIENCLTLLKDNRLSELDYYIEQVSEYKYHLEQMQTDRAVFP